ncbi:MAG TPA: hypothetical protein VGR57_16780, partial [Ktedonobacterales bacterium]|nr:hypothetical protein [Ktedonobacterales bacterium]
MTGPTPSRRPWRQSIHPHHPFWRHVYRTLSGVYQFLIWIVVGFLVFTIGTGILASLVISGNAGVPDPRQWAIVKPMLAHPLAADLTLAGLLVLALIARRGHLAHTAAQKGHAPGTLTLPRVDQLDPNDYVPRYVSVVYLKRQDPANGAMVDD